MLSIQTKPSLYRDFALLSVLIIFILFMVSIWIVIKTYQNHSEDTLKHLENEALRIDRALIIEIEQYSYLLESISRQIETDEPNIEDQVARLFQSFSSRENPTGGDFFWANANQDKVLNSHYGRLEKPVDISDRDYMKRSITDPWNIHIGQPVEGRIDKKWIIPVSMGITDEQNRFLGAVGVGINIDALSRVISGVIKDPNIDFAITNTAFTLLTEMSEKPQFFLQHFSLDHLAEINFSTQPNGVYSQASLWERDNIYAYYETSSQYPYIIFVGYDPESSRTAIDDILIPRLLQIAIMCLFLVLTLWTVRKRIIHPVMLLTQHTSDILKGQPFNHNSSKDPIEIEQLSEEIGRLSDYIEERRRIDEEMSRKNMELMKIREAAEMTNHLKATFFEQVGDALMQPAKSISEYIESMRNELFGPLGNEKYQEMAENMYLESAAIIDTLTDVRAISKAESGLLALNESWSDLSFIIKKCIRLLRESPHFQNIEVILDLDDSVPKVLIDELRMKQLILNLLTTAANEIDPHDSIRLNSQYHNDGVRIEIIFKPSLIATRRMDTLHSQTSSRQAQPSSAGFLKLGHALSELIITMHGGEISSQAMPDNLVKKVVSIPQSRIFHAS